MFFIFFSLYTDTWTSGLPTHGNASGYFNRASVAGCPAVLLTRVQLHRSLKVKHGLENWRFFCETLARTYTCTHTNDVVQQQKLHVWWGNPQDRNFYNSLSGCASHRIASAHPVPQAFCLQFPPSALELCYLVLDTHTHTHTQFFVIFGEINFFNFFSFCCFSQLYLWDQLRGASNIECNSLHKLTRMTVYI